MAFVGICRHFQQSQLRTIPYPGKNCRDVVAGVAGMDVYTQGELKDLVDGVRCMTQGELKDLVDVHDPG